MTLYDPKYRRPYPSAPLYEYAVQRGEPEPAVPLGELPNAAIESAMLPVADLLRHLMAQGTAGGGSMPPAGNSLPNLPRPDDAPVRLPVPRYRTKPPLGYRIPILPRQERPASSMWEIAGTPSSPDFDNAVLYDRMLKAAVAEREAASGRVAEAKKRAPAMPDVERTSPMDHVTKTAQAGPAIAADEFAGPVQLPKGGYADVAEPGTAILKAGPPTRSAIDANKMLQDLEFDPNGPAEEIAGAEHPGAAAIALIERERAGDAAKARFPHLTNWHNNEADAFRHTLWSYRIARWFGDGIAKKFGDAHEISDPNPLDERLMDLYNNNVARRLAADPRNRYRDDEEVILDAIRRGELQTRPFAIVPGTRPPGP